MSKEIKVPVIVEHYEGDENWRAYVYKDQVIQAEGANPEEATSALTAEIDYFTSNPDISPKIREEHLTLLRNMPKIGVTEVVVQIEDKQNNV